MATKKKTKKKQTKAKRVTSKKRPAKRRVTKRSAPRKSAKHTSEKKSAKKKAAPKATARKTARGRGRPVRGKSERRVETVPLSREGLRARSGGQSGDLQGLSNIEGAASESVDELLEEGNAFEADAVKGVEDAGDESEVHTHEVPEDDVPDEYLDNE